MGANIAVILIGFILGLLSGRVSRLARRVDALEAKARAYWPDLR